MTASIATVTQEQFDQYKQLVRTVAIRVAKENDWCDDGLNDVLQELGLPKVQKFRIPVRVNGKTWSVEVRDAETEQQAREMLKADPAKTLSILQYEYGFYALTDNEVEVVEPPAQPEPGSGVPLKGDPAPEDGAWYATSVMSGGPNQCRVNGYTNGELYCTRPLDHAADWHVAAGKNAGVLEVWPAKEGDKRTTPAPEMPTPEFDDDYGQDVDED